VQKKYDKQVPYGYFQDKPFVKQRVTASPIEIDVHALSPEHMDESRKT